MLDGDRPPQDFVLGRLSLQGLSGPAHCLQGGRLFSLPVSGVTYLKSSGLNRMSGPLGGSWAEDNPVQVAFALWLFLWFLKADQNE